MENNRREIKLDDESALLTFLKMTKDERSMGKKSFFMG